MKRLNKLLAVIFLIPCFIVLAVFPDALGTTDSYALEISPPSGFRSEIYNHYVQLSWTDNNGYSSHTVIEKSTDQGDFSPIATYSKSTSSLKDYSVSNGHVYTYRARTYYGSVKSSYTEEIEAVVLYPSSFGISRALSDQVDLEWTYPSLALSRNPEYETVIERRSGDSSSWKVIGEVPSAETTFRDTTVSIDARYYYRIRTRYGSGRYSYYIPSNSGLSTRTAYPLTTPLWGYAVRDTHIRLEWDISLADGGSIILQKQNQAGDFSTIFTSKVASSYNDYGLEKGTTCRYRLAMESENGMDSEYTDTVEIIAETVPAPTDLSVWAVSSDKIALSWVYPHEVETGFEVWRKGSGIWELVASIPKNSESYTDSGIQSGESYTYKVRAIRGLTAYSVFSQPKSVINEYPPQPKPLVYLATNGFMMIVSADPVPADTRYTLEYRNSINSPWKDYATSDKDALAAYVGYSGSTEYYFRLRANIGSLASYSTEFHFFGAPPDPVQNLKAPLIGYDRVLISWDDVSLKEQEYHIYRTANGTRTYIGSSAMDAESFTDDTPVPGTNSLYEVVGINAAGQSAARSINVTVPNVVLFKDIGSCQWAHNAIYVLQGLGALEETGNGYFYPQKVPALGQIVHNVLKSFDIPDRSAGVFSISDVTPSHRCYNDLLTAAGLGIIHPDSQGRIFPDKAITRKDLLIILNNTLGYLGITLNTYPVEILQRFSDFSQISFDDAPIIASFVGDSLLTGKNGSLSLDAKATKAEAVTMIYRMLTKYLK